MAEHRFHTPGQLELEVGIPAGLVTVETVDGEESLVTVDGDERAVDETDVELRGDRLTVRFRPRRSLFGIPIGDWITDGSRLTVTARVPHGTALRAATTSADVQVRGRLDTLDVKTVSGDLDHSGEVERHAVIRTVSGDARLDQVGGAVRAQSVSGDVTVGPVGGSFVAKAVSGRVHVASLREGDANFTSVSGDVEIGIATGSFLDVDAGSLSGHLSSEVPLSGERTAGDGGPTVVLRGKTVSGNVTLVRA